MFDALLSGVLPVAQSRCSICCRCRRCWEVGRLTTPTTNTTASAPLVALTPCPCPNHVLLLSRRLTSCAICIGISNQIGISINVFNLSLHCRHLLPLPLFSSSPLSIFVVLLSANYNYRHRLRFN